MTIIWYLVIVVRMSTGTGIDHIPIGTDQARCLEQAKRVMDENSRYAFCIQGVIR